MRLLLQSLQLLLLLERPARLCKDPANDGLRTTFCDVSQLWHRAGVRRIERFVDKVESAFRGKPLRLLSRALAKPAAIGQQCNLLDPFLRKIIQYAAYYLIVVPGDFQSMLTLLDGVDDLIASIRS